MHTSFGIFVQETKIHFQVVASGGVFLPEAIFSLRDKFDQLVPSL
jgi:hypothetical protein